jgi:hypothetical protein
MDQAHGSLQTTESRTRILSFAVPFFPELSSQVFKNDAVIIKLSQVEWVVGALCCKTDDA